MAERGRTGTDLGLGDAEVDAVFPVFEFVVGEVGGAGKLTADDLVKTLFVVIQDVDPLPQLVFPGVDGGVLGGFGGGPASWRRWWRGKRGAAEAVLSGAQVTADSTAGTVPPCGSFCGGHGS